MGMIKECYKSKTEMFEIEIKLSQLNTVYEQLLRKEYILTRRENTIKAFLEERKLTQSELDFATDPNAVF